VRSANLSPNSSDADVPVVGLREPCPCGSGRRYKACHGRGLADAGSALVQRPFAGLASEPDWVALREIVPSATSALTLSAEYAAQAAGRQVLLATVLPMAWPALVRADGTILLGLQTATGSGDPSRDLGDVLARALSAEPGGPVSSLRLGDGPRLQEVLDVTVPLEVTVHDGFEFWVDASQTEMTADVSASLEMANSTAMPTYRLTSVEAAYWCRMGPKEFLRWAQPHDEEPLLSALARLQSRGESALGSDTRLIGTFRAHGLLVPVWDLPSGTEPQSLEEPAGAFLERLNQVLTETGELNEAERRARAGLANRQVTLR